MIWVLVEDSLYVHVSIIFSTSVFNRALVEKSVFKAPNKTYNLLLSDHIPESSILLVISAFVIVPSP